MPLSRISTASPRSRVDTFSVGLTCRLPPSGGWWRIKSVAEEVETDPGDVLWGKFDRGDRVGIFALQCDLETLTLGAATVIGEI